MAAIAFLWNATRGHRFRPWRSEYLKWRIETYSGLKAESITARQFWRFVWQEKRNLWHFLSWTNEVQQRPSRQD